MMGRKYYHVYPTCPNRSCNEPHKSGAFLEINDDHLRCTGCGTCFRETLDLLTSGKFNKTLHAIQNFFPSDDKEFLEKFRKLKIPWEVRLNPIEASYVEWLRSTENGKFLITWPADKVRFVPILVAEYLMDRPEKSAAIVGNIVKNSTKDRFIRSPAVNEIYNNIIFLEDSENLKGCSDREIFRECRELDYRYLIKKLRVVRCRIKRTGKPGYYSEKICYETFRKCKNRCIKELNELGRNSIRFIEEKRFQGEKTVSCINKDGLFDIALIEEEEWSTKRINYDKNFLWTVLLNANKLRHLTKIVPPVLITDPIEYETENKRLFLISENLDVESILGILNELKPDLIIFQNFDDFMEDCLFEVKKMEFLKDFLKDFNNSIMLLFSTRNDYRQLYNINSEKHSGVGISIRDLNIIPHTWDSPKIVKKILEVNGFEKDHYYSPLSSIIRDPEKDIKFPEIEYVDAEKPIDLLDDVIQELKDAVDRGLLDRAVFEDYEMYLKNLKKTPLMIRGDYTEPHVFSQNGRNSGKITFDSLMNNLESLLDREKYERITNIFRSIFGMEFSDINPIFKKMIQKIEEMINAENVQIIISTSKKEKSGLNKLLKDKLKDSIWERYIHVVTWDEITRSEIFTDKNKKIFIISTTIPPFNYSLAFSAADKLIFIGSKKYLDKIESMINYRLDFPIYFIKEDEPAPKLLKDVMKDLNVPPNERIQEILGELKFEYQEELKMSNAVEKNYRYSKLKVGENALLLITDQNMGIFIPEGVSIIFRINNRIEEFNSEDILENKNMLEDLKNKEILLDKRGLYISFRCIFINLMTHHGRDIRFRKGPYTWSNFIDLLEDSTRWLNLIISAIERYSSTNNISFDEAEEYIARLISSLNITARNPHYIKTWWKIHEEVTTENGIFRIYRIEHPKNPHDMEKIFGALFDRFPSLKSEDFDPLKSYAAAILIQHFRTSLLKRNKGEIEMNLLGLYDLVEQNLEKIIKSLNASKIVYATKCKIVKEVEPYVLLENYRDFIEK